MPAQVVKAWKEELAITKETDQLSPACVELRRRIAKYEDSGYGSCWLKERAAAEIVQNALLFFDNERYRLISWCVMPNHVHVLIERLPGHSLASILHSWKSFTAVKINKLFDRSGELWEREEHDRFVRNERHFENVKSYIEENPVAAGLVRVAADWKFSSAGRGA